MTMATVFRMVVWSIVLPVAWADGGAATSESARAEKYPESRGEVFFSFRADAYRRNEPLGERISIDRIVGNTIFAYANSREFDWFAAQNIEYRVLVPPGLRVRPRTLAKKTASSSADSFSYPTFHGYIAAVEQLAAAYPSICSVTEIGTSVKGRRILALKISDNVTEKEAEPEFICTGTIHGDETVGMMILKKMAEHLCSNYGVDSNVTRIVNGLELWMIPLANPDGMYMYGMNDSLGDPFRDNANMVDLNRNFPDPELGWNDSSLQPETRSIITFAKRHCFSMGIDIHAGANYVVYPFAYTARYPVDKEWWVYVAGNYVRTMRAAIESSTGNDDIVYTTAGYLSAGAENYAASGTLIDFPYYFLHCRSLTVEMSSMKYTPEDWLEPIWQNNRQAMLDLFMEGMVGIRGIVTDSATGSPLSDVKVFVGGLDADSSFTRSNSAGVFFRPIIEGTYSITFSGPGYLDKTVAGIIVVNGQQTVLEVTLSPGTSIGNDDRGRIRAASPAVRWSDRGLTVVGGNPRSRGAMFDLSGRSLGRFSLCGGQGTGGSVPQGNGPLDGAIANGCVLVRLTDGSSATGVYRVVKPAVVR